MSSFQLSISLSVFVDWIKRRKLRGRIFSIDAVSVMMEYKLGSIFMMLTIQFLFFRLFTAQFRASLCMKRLKVHWYEFIYRKYIDYSVVPFRCWNDCIHLATESLCSVCLHMCIVLAFPLLKLWNEISILPRPILSMWKTVSCRKTRTLLAHSLHFK